MDKSVTMTLEGVELEVSPVVLTSKARDAVDRLYWEMTAEGYEARAPSAEVEEMDRLVIEGGKRGALEFKAKSCIKCGGELLYQPYVKGRSYRSWTVCRVCGRVKEF